MNVFSTANWTAHELGLAAAVGSTMLGRAAMRPALQEIADPEDRDRVSSGAWRRFSWLNLAAHGVVAATWFAGRSLLGTGKMSASARSLTRIKDGLVIASVATGIGGVVLGRALAKIDREVDNDNVNVISEANQFWRKRNAVRRAGRAVGLANLLANVAILGITSMLAVQSSRS